MSEATTCVEAGLIAAFVRGEVSEEERARVEAHADGCPDCLQLIAVLARSARAAAGASAAGPAGQGSELEAGPVRLERGDSVGRYLVIDELGRGGMGVVYAAFDPELNRKVAIKLLRPEGHRDDDAARARLIREARALARVVHPATIAVHDVGTVGDQVYITMELIDGVTLGAWCQADRRTWREILAAYCAAGRGLAAAHAAGLVHRDFKPSNVLVARDGRVVVVDFGLAAPLGQDSGESELAPLLAAAGSDPGDGGDPGADALTATGVAIGTPAYMSPEQTRAEQADARSDQFSFCVALHEALAGASPFAAGSPVESIRARRDGRVGPWPADSRVPRRVRRALRRGLQPSRRDRFPSMDDLLRELTPPQPRRLLWLAAPAAGLAAALAIAWPAGDTPRPCEGAERRLAGAWDDARRAELRGALLASGAPFASSVWTSVEAGLDRYRRDWATQHRAACEATRVTGEQPEQHLSARMVCLERRRTELIALVDLLATAGGGEETELVARAPDAVAALPPVAACGDIVSLTAPEPEPGDPARRQAIEEVRRAMAEARALRDTGRYPQALAAIEGAAARLDEIGHRPTEAEILLLLGDVRERSGALPEGAEAIERAIWAAEAGRHDRVAAAGWMELLWNVGYRQAKHEEVERLDRRASAALARLGGDPELAARRAMSLGQIAGEKGDPAAAERHLREALALTERRLGEEHPRTAAALGALAGTLKNAGRFDESQALFERALRISEAHNGERHPNTAELLGNLGNLLQARGDLTGARQAQERALAIKREVFGPAHQTVAITLYNLGSLEIAAGEYQQAAENFRGAIEAFRGGFGAEHPYVARGHNALGRALALQGQRDAAIAEYERALGLQEKALGPEHPDVGSTLTNLGLELLAGGDAIRALGHERRAVAVLEKAYGADHPSVASALANLALVLHDLGRGAEALPHLERAARIARERQAPVLADVLRLTGLIRFDRGDHARAAPLLEAALASYGEAAGEGRADAEWMLARILWKRGERERALELAGSALAARERAGTDAAPIRAWLAARR